MLPFSQEKVLKFLDNKENEQELKKDLKEYKVLHEKKGEFEVNYYRSPGIALMSDRDWVTVGKLKYIGNQVYIAEKSSSYPYD